MANSGKMPELMGGASAGLPKPVGLADMNTCGSCVHFERLPHDLAQGVCFGAPPTPVITGMSSHGVQMSSQRAMVPSSSRICGAYRLKPTPIIGGAS